MPLANAILRIDHHSAEVLEFDASQVQAHHLRAHPHHTRQHHSEVRTEHEFFAEVCDTLAGIAGVICAGSHPGLAAFRHYVEKHRPAVGKKILHWEVVDRPSEAQLVAYARKFVATHERMAEPAA